MTAFFSNPKPNWKCKLGFHWWSLYAGYGKERIHRDAVCLRCGKSYFVAKEVQDLVDKGV